MTKQAIVNLNYDIVDADLTDKTVLLRQSFFKSDLIATNHPFLCKAGFGCEPDKTGSKIFGIFVNDQEETMIRREHVQAIITYEQTT